jgi:hypothetical protein
MLSPRISSLGCIFLSTLSLATGFGISGQWLALGLTVVIMAMWLSAFRKDGGWLATLALVSAAAQVTVGMLAGASPYLMFPGAILALASWDLTLFDHYLARNAGGPMADRLVRKHYASLALVMGVGLIALAADQLVRLQIPFLLMVVLAIGLTFFLERAWRSLQR